MSENQAFRTGLRAIHPTTGHEVIVLNPEHGEALTELAAVAAERDRLKTEAWQQSVAADCLGSLLWDAVAERDRYRTALDLLIDPKRSAPVLADLERRQAEGEADE